MAFVAEFVYYCLGLNSVYFYIPIAILTLGYAEVGRVAKSLEITHWPNLEVLSFLS